MSVSPSRAHSRWKASIAARITRRFCRNSISFVRLVGFGERQRNGGKDRENRQGHEQFKQRHAGLFHRTHHSCRINRFLRRVGPGMFGRMQPYGRHAGVFARNVTRNSRPSSFVAPADRCRRSSTTPSANDDVAATGALPASVPNTSPSVASRNPSTWDRTPTSGSRVSNLVHEPPSHRHEPLCRPEPSHLQAGWKAAIPAWLIRESPRLGFWIRDFSETVPQQSATSHEPLLASAAWRIMEPWNRPIRFRTRTPAPRTR